LIIGENGAGKSTILDALSFGLYGKPFRKINKPQLLNAINQRDPGKFTRTVRRTDANT
jgi:DNA repair exonuclease SbcCD ATPase subunit